MTGLSIVDGLLVAGFFGVAYVLACFIKDDNEVPDVPEGEPSTEAVESDDDLDLSWSGGVGDWK